MLPNRVKPVNICQVESPHIGQSIGKHADRKWVASLTRELVSLREYKVGRELMDSGIKKSKICSTTSVPQRLFFFHVTSF